MHRYHHGDLKRALLDQAEELVRKGDDPAIRRAATAAGVTPSAAYRHFASRDDLLDALAARWLQRLGAAMVADLAAEPDQEPLVVVSRAYLRAAVADPNLFRLAAGPHGFGRSGGVLGTGPEGPLPQQCYLRAAVPELAERAWIATHGLAMLTIDGPYSPQAAEELLPDLLPG